MIKNNAKIVFMGTPEFAVASLQALIESGYRVIGVVTAPDKPIGKHQSILHASPIKRYALSKNLPILQPEKLTNFTFINKLTEWKADLQIVVAFRILPEIVWKIPYFGTFCLHASLLPQYRGAAPIHWAIINGEKETGVTTFFINHAIDAGKIIAQKRISIEEIDNAKTIHDKLMELGAKLILQTVDDLLHNKITPIIQVESNQDQNVNLKYAPKIFTNTCKIDWNQTTQAIHYFVRGLSPNPGAWTDLIVKKGTLSIKIFETEFSERSETTLPTGSVVSDKKRIMDIRALDGWIRIKSIQLKGKKRMPINEFLKGNAHLL